MTNYLFDIETNGLLDEGDTVHCLVTKDLDTGKIHRYDESGKHDHIAEGVKSLMYANSIWGHNLISFDIPFLVKCYPYFRNYTAKVYDTLIMSRMFFTDLLDRDFRNKPPNMPAQMYGRHGLEAWGYRLGVMKSEYGKSLDGDWSSYTPEMLEYCVADVEANTPLVELFKPKIDVHETSIRLETECAKVMQWQWEVGFPFNEAKAHQLETKLRVELETLSDEMRSTFPHVDGGNFTPARPNQNKGYVTGAEFCRLREFNPTSRQHIAFAFQNFRGWEATEKTDTGRPKIDEKVLMELGTNESKKFARILELQKALGQLSEGQNAWLKLVDKTGKIHHSCSLATNTFRQAHYRPNLSQVNSAQEYRELFHAGAGRVQVGADASQLELRGLGHYLSLFDGGEFSKEVVEGDIHTRLAKIYGTSRQVSKTVTYCMIYGGGDFRIGLSAGFDKKQAAKEGKRIRAAVLNNLKGYRELSLAIQQKARFGVLKALDGRPLRIGDKSHVAMNYLIQSAGAIICKTWLVESIKKLKAQHVDFVPLAFIHDEIQLSVHPKDTNEAKKILEETIIDVQAMLAFRCELAAESKSGLTWWDCH